MSDATSLRAAILVGLSPDPDHTSCARCSRELRSGDPVFDGLYIDVRGRLFPHHFCQSCGTQMHADPRLYADAVSRVELMFETLAGRA
jgi:hypothetical protein